jgi:radical SAM superfamily enzyme YgiQ (UPF0313 family)
MKIQLILPKRQQQSPYQADFKFLSRLFSPVTGIGGQHIYLGSIGLALPTIAGLTPPDVDVVITDERIDPIDFSEHFDIVGISLPSDSAQRGYEIAGEYRKRGVYVALGGPHASWFPTEAESYADTVFVGEAEDTWPTFIEDYRRNRPQRRYTSEPKPDLGKLVIPRWDLIKTRAYYTYYVQTTRGCVFDCDFCSVRAQFGKPRHKPIENVIAEIQAVRRHARVAGYELIYFADDNIFSNSEYSKQLFRELIPLNIRWSAECSVNIARDDEALDLAKESGCISLLMGFESISQASLESINKGKGNRVEEYEEVINKIHSRSINIMLMMMLGLDGDDDSVFESTAEFIKRVGVACPAIAILTPMVGTRLHSRMEKEGRLLDPGRLDCSATTVNFKPKNMSISTLQEGFYWVLREIYSSEAILERIERLYEKGVIRHQKKHNLTRFLLTVLLFLQFMRQKGEMAALLKKSMKMLWEKRGITFDVLLMNLSQFDYVKDLPVPNIRFGSPPKALDPTGTEGE